MNPIFFGDSHRRILHVVSRLAALFCLVGIVLVGVKLVQASVTLSGTVTAQSVAEGINIRWETGTETDTQLFHLLRSTDESGPFQPVPICIRDNKDGGAIVNAVFAQGDISGFVYEVTDLAIDLDSSNQRVDDLISGKTYYYLLVEKDASGYVTYPVDIAVVTYSRVGAGPTPSTQPCPIASPLPGVTPGPLPSAHRCLTTTVTVTPPITALVTTTATVTITARPLHGYGHTGFTPLYPVGDTPPLPRPHHYPDVDAYMDAVPYPAFNVLPGPRGDRDHRSKFGVHLNPHPHPQRLSG